MYSAQRTLVKSAPELWGELSDPDSLARRLEHFGDGWVWPRRAAKYSSR